LISRVHLPSFVIVLPKQLKYSTFSKWFYLPYSVLATVALRFSSP
jgi:hypothetical protein